MVIRGLTRKPGVLSHLPQGKPSGPDLFQEIRGRSEQRVAGIAVVIGAPRGLSNHVSVCHGSSLKTNVDIVNIGAILTPSILRRWPCQSLAESLKTSKAPLRRLCLQLSGATSRIAPPAQ